MRKIRLFALATAVHLLATIGALLVSFSIGFSAFDGHPPHALSRPASMAFSILSWPIMPLLAHSSIPHQAFRGLLGYVPFAANSSLWGALATALAALATHFRHRLHSNGAA